MTGPGDHGSWTPAALLDETLRHTAPGLVTELTAILTGEQVARLCQAIGRAQEISFRRFEDQAAAENLQTMYDDASARLAAWRDENVARIRLLTSERFGEVTDARPFGYNPAASRLDPG